MTLLSIESREEGSITILSLSGPIMAGHETLSLGETLERLVEDGKNRILIDVAEVSFIDSTGIGEVVNGFTIAKKSGGALKLSCLTGRVREVLKVTGLLGVLDIHETVQDALASFE